MPKRESESPDINWDAEEAESAEDAGEFAGGGGGNSKEAAARPGFHLKAARRIEEAREKRAPRKAIEDFDDYDV
jgi:hypothetical protein